jgi:hypothetical protein
MADDIDFDDEKFLALPLDERVRACKRFAARAEEIADGKKLQHYRTYYLEIAIAWLRLADDMERAARSTEKVGMHH